MTRTIYRFVSEIVDQLPEVLIEERKRSGVTQKQIADRLGLKEQQIQRYESTRYQSASLKRINDISRVLFELSS